MNQNDLNQIRGVIKEEVEPVVKKLNSLLDQVVKNSEDIEEIKETLDSHTKILDSHTLALEKIEENTDSNRDNIGKLDKRASEVTILYFSGLLWYNTPQYLLKLL